MGRHRAAETADSAETADAAQDVWPEGTREALLATGLDPGWVRDLVLRALAEDLGPDWDDVTTAATVPVQQTRRGEVSAREDGIVAGLLLWPVLLAEAAAGLRLPAPTVDLRVADGSRVNAGDVLIDVRGRTRVLLAAERTAAGLVGHLCGVATTTAAWVETLTGTGAALLDTRACTPGLRPLERYAVRCGGGANGRAGLYDAAHVTTAHTDSVGSVSAALDAVRRRLPTTLVQIDVRTPNEAVEAVLNGARFVVCDSMHPEMLAEAVSRIRASTLEWVEIAASGITELSSAKDYAQTGVNHLYVDSLVRSATALDLDLEIF